MLGSFSTEVMCVVVATEQGHAPNVHVIDEAPTREGNIAIAIVVGAEVHAMLEQKPEQKDLKKVCMHIGLCNEQSWDGDACSCSVRTEQCLKKKLLNSYRIMPESHYNGRVRNICKTTWSDRHHSNQN